MAALHPVSHGRGTALGVSVFWLLAGTAILSQTLAPGAPAEHAVTGAADQKEERADRMATLQAEAARLQTAVEQVSPSNKDNLARSAHKTLGCTDCHGETEMAGGTGERTGGRGEMGGRPDPVTTCARCHAPAMAAYLPSAHAVARDLGTPNAATCVACHGSHAVKAVRPGVSGVDPARVREHLRPLP